MEVYIMRRIYLDNTRWAAVVLVMVYHVFYMFNACGVLGGVGSFSSVQYQDAFLYFVYPWFMVLFFIIAGMSARYSLEKISGKEFLCKRTWKLLVPSTIGLFVYHWIAGYYNIKIGGGLEYIPSFMVYPVSAVSGTGPMWFAQVLWIFSVLLLLIRRLDKKERILKLGRECKFPVLVLYVLVIWGSAQVLNMPVITTYRFGIYLATFLSGYFIISHNEVQEMLGKMHMPLLTVAVITGILYTIHYFGREYSSEEVLKSLHTNIYAWFMPLAILGCGKVWYNKQNKLAIYMSKSSYGLYVLHYPVTLIPCYYLKNYAGLPAWAIYVMALFITFTGTFILYGIVKRIPAIRCLVLGTRRKDNVKR